MERMARTSGSIRRIVLVTLDGFAPEWIDQYGLTNIQRLAYGGAWTTRAEPVLPSVSLRMLFQDVAERVTGETGAPGTRFVGRDSQTVLRTAEATLSFQRRGLIVMHWPDAERTVNESGFASNQVHQAARQLDESLRVLAAHTEVSRDPGTVLIVVSDHAKTGMDHPLLAKRDHRELLVVAGAPVIQSPLPKTVSVLDVAPTVLWALGIGGAGVAGALPIFRDNKDRAGRASMSIEHGANR
jgi:hypothetical protein